MDIKSSVIPACALSAGVFIGWILPHGRKSGDTPAAAADHPVSAHVPVSRGSAPDTLAERFAQHAAPPTEDAAKVPDTVRVPPSLIETLSLAAGTRKLDQDLFSRDDKIAEALQINDNEKASIQTAWRDTRRKIDALQTGSMKTDSVDQYTERITIPDLSKAMASLGDDFRRAVRQALGKDRSAAFLAAKQVDRMFTPSSGETVYTVTSEAIGDGHWRYQFKMQGPGGQRVWVGQNVPEELRHLTDAARIQPSLPQ